MEFKHERLKLSENSIRLLRILSGTNNDTISLRITQYALIKRPAYCAISYTWGSQLELRPVFVNGKPFQVHQNLWDLLYHLRQRGESRFIWVDALCINQRNLAERNFHVQLMSQIYDRADSAIVWLGLPSDDRREARALEFIKEMADFRGKHSITDFKNKYMVEPAVRRWQGLLELCHRAYWTRTWIIQEFLKAPRLDVFCGKDYIPWQHFEALVKILREIEDDATSISTITDVLFRSIPYRLTVRRLYHATSSLQELLSEFHDSDCAESRDRIYAMLGIACDCGIDADSGEFRGPQPDYGKHIVQVYVEVFDYLRAISEDGDVPVMVALLLRKALNITSTDLKDFARLHRIDDSWNRVHGWPTTPDHINVVQDVIPSWSSLRDLRQKLERYDWAQYVGYHFQGRARTAPIPDNLINNVVHAAEHLEDLYKLYSYEVTEGACLHVSHVLSTLQERGTGVDGRQQKPVIVFEHDEVSDVLRVGFACTTAKRGDLICQFRGIDSTLIARRSAAGNHEFDVVGKAVMITHCGSLSECEVHPVYSQPRLVSPCLENTNSEQIELWVEPLSLLELLPRS